MSKNWCFTINNPTDDDMLPLQDNPKIKYIIVGKETGTEGTEHAQGFLILHSNMRLTAIKKLLPRAHLEMAKGSAQQAADYCKKDGDFTEQGELPLTRKQIGEAESERWKRIRTLATEGKLEEIEDKIYVTHYRTLQAISKDHPRKQETLPELTNLWYVGESGTGKSRLARESNPGAYIKNCNKWWDGYNDEEVVIVEDIDNNHEVLGHHIKLWTDHYPFTAEIKGGSKVIRPKQIIFTSNFDISEIFLKPEHHLPLQRRIKTIRF